METVELIALHRLLLQVFHL
jgi:hypothetical protein